MNQEGFKRKLTAILSADVAGYSRLMGEDEDATVRTITTYREVLSTLIRQHNGEVVDAPGDNLLAQFESVINAVQCAVEIQKEIHIRNEDLSENRRMRFRIGINLGDIIQEKERIYGDGVNIAARLEALADPGGICISSTVHDQMTNRLPYGYAFLGNQTVKNIARPIGVYRVLMEPGIRSEAGPKKESPLFFRRIPILKGVLAVLILIVAAGSLQFYARRTDPLPVSEKISSVPLPEKTTIAVLPFENMSGDPDQDYFSDGMTEEIITKLSQYSRIAVIARNSTFFYKGKQVKIGRVARELGAGYVVEGSVRKAGNTVRITAQLIDAATQSHLWAKTYDRELKDIFKLQDEIAQQIASALNAESLEAEQARAWRTPTENLTAYDSMLQGLSHFSRLTVQENTKARVLFEKAIALDPEYAVAHALLGYALYIDYVFGLNRDPKALDQVSGLAQKALSLDDSLSLAHVLLADVYRLTGRLEQAMSQVKRALSLNPNEAHANLILGSILSYTGRSEEAVGAIKKAMHLNPHYTANYSVDLAHAYRNLGRYREAIVSLKEALSQNPDWMPAYFELAMSYLMEWGTVKTPDPSLLEQAVKMGEKLVAADDSSWYGHFTLGLIHLYQRYYDKAVADAERLLALYPGNADSYILMSMIVNAAGKPEEAVELAEKAIQLNPSAPAWYLNTLATALAASSRRDEAIQTYHKMLDRNPSHSEAVSAHLILAILYMESGRDKEARAQAEAVLKLNPEFSVAVWGQRNPGNNREQIKQNMEALRKAGLK